jgi:hypothetical protein
MSTTNGYGRSFGFKASNFGKDTKGHDVKAFGDTTGKYFMWDASADTFILAGTLTHTGTLGLTGDLELATGQNVKGSRFTVTYPQVAAADVAKTFFVATAPCKIVKAYERHVTVAGQAGTLTIEKLTTGEAPSAGDVILAAAFDLTSTANTPVTKAGVTTAAGSLVAGDALCLKLASGAATSYDLGTITVEMEWL